jgi:uncharacterized protein (TIGR02996 family)
MLRAIHVETRLHRRRQGFPPGHARQPDDITTWLVYADWLDESGDPRAEYLRLQVDLGRGSNRAEARLRELCQTLDPDWLAIVDRPAIENCPAPFAFRCPRKWEQLSPTRDVSVRYCDRCQQEVYYCRSLDEARQFATGGDCVALSRVLPRTPGDLDAGGLTDEEIELGDLDPEDDEADENAPDSRS